MRPVSAALALACLGWTVAPAAAAQPQGCFATCMAPFAPKSDDYFPFANHVKECRDRCDAAALDALKSSGAYDAYAACKPAPLSKQEFRDSGRPIRPGRRSSTSSVGRPQHLPEPHPHGITVKTQDMNLIDVELTADGVIAPDKAGTFVIPDFFDGYPAVRYATKVTSVTACTID